MTLRHSNHLSMQSRANLPTACVLFSRGILIGATILLESHLESTRRPGIALKRP